MDDLPGKLMALRGIVDQYDRGTTQKSDRELLMFYHNFQYLILSMFGELDVSTNMTLKMR